MLKKWEDQSSQNGKIHVKIWNGEEQSLKTKRSFSVEGKKDWLSIGIGMVLVLEE